MSTMVKGSSTVLKMIRGESIIVLNCSYCSCPVFWFNKLCMLHVSLVCSTSHGTAMSIRNSGLNLESQTLTASGKRPELDSI